MFPFSFPYAALGNTPQSYAPPSGSVGRSAPHATMGMGLAGVEIIPPAWHKHSQNTGGPFGGLFSPSNGSNMFEQSLGYQRGMGTFDFPHGDGVQIQEDLEMRSQEDQPVATYNYMQTQEPRDGTGHNRIYRMDLVFGHSAPEMGNADTASKPLRSLSGLNYMLFVHKMLQKFRDSEDIRDAWEFLGVCETTKRGGGGATYDVNKDYTERLVDVIRSVQNVATAGLCEVRNMFHSKWTPIYPKDGNALRQGAAIYSLLRFIDYDMQVAAEPKGRKTPKSVLIIPDIEKARIELVKVFEDRKQQQQKKVIVNGVLGKSKFVTSTSEEDDLGGGEHSKLTQNDDSASEGMYQAVPFYQNQGGVPDPGLYTNMTKGTVGDKWFHGTMVAQTVPLNVAKHKPHKCVHPDSVDWADDNYFALPTFEMSVML